MINMKRFGLTLLVVVGALNVAAQAPAPAGAAAPLQVISPEQKAVVAEMLEAINFKQMMAQMGAAMTQGMPQMMAQSLEATIAKLPLEQRAKAREVAQESMKSSLNESMKLYTDPAIISGMEDIMGRAYARRFSLDEVKAITAFYKSAAGKKMMTDAPQIMQETMPEMAALMSPRMTAMIERVTKDVAEKAKGKSAGK